MPRWLLSDLHIHTTFSDGDLPLKEVVKIYGEAGFDVIAITDHLFDTQSPRSVELYKEEKSIIDLNSYFLTIKEVSGWAKETYDLLVIPGLEICNLSEDYHILGIDMKGSINPNQDAEGVIEEIHHQGGLAIVSHPHLKLSYFIEGDNVSIQRHPLHLWKHREKYFDKFDAWEIANREDLFPIISLEHLPFVANSDFHERPHLTSWKSLIFSEKEKEAIKEAIHKRKLSLFFFSDNGWTKKLPQTKVFHEERGKIDQLEGTWKGKILIADDERDLVEMLRYNLEKRGYQTVAAYDGFEAWNRIQSEKPDLLILDLMMPELDGWGLCRLIRRSEQEGIKGIGILMLTARAMPEDRVYGLEIGADDYLTKPFSINELLLRVEKLVEKRKSVYQLKEEMESLHSSIQRKETDLKRVAHDLKNPLLTIGASAKRMLRRNQNEEEIKILRMIYDSSMRLNQWVDDTLSFKKIEDELKEVDIRPLIQQVINLQKERMIEKKIEIFFEASPSLPLIRCHEQLIFRVIENLLNNALKYTPEGGRVNVIITPHTPCEDEGIVEISVKDTGIGIPKEDIEKIFDPLYRGNNVSKEIGTGLGLSFVQHAVDLHGGRISVQSELEKGSTFSVMLPIHTSFNKNFT